VGGRRISEIQNVMGNRTPLPLNTYRVFSVVFALSPRIIIVNRRRRRIGTSSCAWHLNAVSVQSSNSASYIRCSPVSSLLPKLCVLAWLFAGSAFKSNNNFKREPHWPKMNWRDACIQEGSTNQSLLWLELQMKTLLFKTSFER